jgi:hypothetical protein
VANTDILGRPDNAQQFGQNFIMTPPPPPVQGTGVIDANGLEFPTKNGHEVKGD